jgi:hypothetical protein
MILKSVSFVFTFSCKGIRYSAQTVIPNPHETGIHHTVPQADTVLLP